MRNCENNRTTNILQEEENEEITVHCFCMRRAAAAVFPLSLHAALPTSARVSTRLRTPSLSIASAAVSSNRRAPAASDRKSTRLNSSHRCISYAVFCLKKKIIVNIRAERAAQKNDAKLRKQPDY